ncbi:MAG: carboxymuconolactone decarboxylase family protein [Azospirillaceae bacterium]
MALIDPLPTDATPELEEAFAFFMGPLGFVPNSMRIMQRRPAMVKAFSALNAAVMAGAVDPGLKRLIGHVASRVAGCQYCMAHTVLGAERKGIAEDKLHAVWVYPTSPLFSAAERAALDFAAAAASVPNAVTPEIAQALKAHWSEDEIVEILGVVALFGFLNRWNDSLATPLEDEAGRLGDTYLADHGWTRGKHEGG